MNIFCELYAVWFWPIKFKLILFDWLETLVMFTLSRNHDFNQQCSLFSSMSGPGYISMYVIHGMEVRDMSMCVCLQWNDY